ncbi:tyrosine-type recombinase/integrase [Enterococcus sp. AZ103]|uniref:tyrosine-type recombinase/integrase n=1 Tax=Enterococcus sp. AZ103 TaxID=2774628 RepID=UPI003F27B7AC
MPKRGENIYKRKDLRWEGRYKKGIKENGKIHYGYIYGRSYKEVKEKLYYYKLTYQKVCQQNGLSAQSYEEWVYQWLKERRKTLKESTYATYFYKLKRYVFSHIGNIPLNQLTKESIQQVIDTLSDQKLGASTIHVIYQIVKKSLQDALTKGKINQQLCHHIDLPKKQKKMIRSLSTEEEEKVEIAAKQLPLSKGLPIILALNTGLRIGEISALKWSDIDFKAKTLRVTQSYQRVPLQQEQQKTTLLFTSAKSAQSIRVVPIGRNLYKWLKKGARKATGPYVCSSRELPQEPRQITYYFHQILTKCDLKNIHFHQLRHTFATRCIEANASITAVSAILGHASTQMTLDVYTDANLKSRQQAILKKEQIA